MRRRYSVQLFCHICLSVCGIISMHDDDNIFTYMWFKRTTNQIPWVKVKLYMFSDMKIYPNFRGFYYHSFVVFCSHDLLQLFWNNFFFQLLLYGQSTILIGSCTQLMCIRLRHSNIFVLLLLLLLISWCYWKTHNRNQFYSLITGSR